MIFFRKFFYGVEVIERKLLVINYNYSAVKNVVK